MQSKILNSRRALISLNINLDQSAMTIPDSTGTIKKNEKIGQIFYPPPEQSREKFPEKYRLFYYRGKLFQTSSEMIVQYLSIRKWKRSATGRRALKRDYLKKSRTEK